MRLRSRFFECFASVPALAALALVCGLAHAQTNTPLSGSYGFLIGQSFASSDEQKGLTFVGVMNLDGAGNIAAQATFQNGAGPNHGAQTGSTPFSGTYSSKPDGTGSLTIGIPGDLTLTFAIVIADGGQGLNLVATKCSIGPDSCGPDPSVTTGVARAIKSGVSSLKGSYGFQTNRAPAPVAIVGVLAFDGAGSATMSFTRVASGGDSASGSFAGSYSINADGTGTINLNDASGQVNLTLAFVATDGGSGLLLIQTKNGDVAGFGPDSNVTFGTARLQ